MVLSRRSSTLAHPLLRCSLLALSLGLGCGEGGGARSPENFNVSPEGFPLWRWAKLNPANPVRSVRKLYIPPPDLSAAFHVNSKGYTPEAFIEGYFEGIERFHDEWHPQIRRVSQPGPGIFTLRAKVVEIRVGGVTYNSETVGNMKSETRTETFSYSDVVVTLIDPDGVEVESYTRREVTDTGLFEERMKSNGRGAGIAVEHYLKARTKGRTVAGP